MYIQAKLVNGEVIEQLVDSNVCVIGRSSKCDVVIPHEGMSRQHCQIEIINGEYFVTDLGSTNGVLIDNERIEPHQKIPYQTFLPLSFGAVQNLQIDEETTGASIVATGGSKAPLEEGGVSSLTRTRTMREPVRPSAPSGNITQPNFKQEKNAKLRLILSGIGAALMILGAIAWYIFQENEDAKEGLELLNKDPLEFREKPIDQF